MERILNKYLSVDHKAFKFIRKNPMVWLEKWAICPHEALMLVTKAKGRLTMDSAIVGEHMLGIMYDPEFIFREEAWAITSKVVDLKTDYDGRLIAKTSDGTSYQLLNTFKPKFYEVVDKIRGLAPEFFRDWLHENVAYWGPTDAIRWDALECGVNRYLNPSSTDPSIVAIYAALYNCTEEEMIRRFEAKGF